MKKLDLMSPDLLKQSRLLSGSVNAWLSTSTGGQLALSRIRIRLMRIGCPDPAAHFEADPDPSFHFDANLQHWLTDLHGTRVSPLASTLTLSRIVFSL
jgi:hypothetical protein